MPPICTVRLCQLPLLLLPPPGQLVAVRGRRFVLNSVTRTELPAQAGNLARAHHLIALTSIEDDALGEEIQVVWEVEPGARAYEESALPPVDGFDPPSRLRDRVWPDLRAPLEATLGERREVRERQLVREREARDMEAVLRELERTIRAQVDAPPRYEQLSLFSAGKREQYDRDLDALRLRLAQIPAEIDRETTAIRERFRDPQARLFPVALLFCIPERMVR
ncbi:MAG: hypothetical protein HGA65_20235 [Oscillochloris sp.]|nr:hypothetical protein [Oscillochloris sp.]